MVFACRLVFLFLITYHLSSNENENSLKIAEELYFQKKYSAALPYLEKLLAQDPQNVRALSLTGDILLFTGRYEEAMVYHRRAAELSSHKAVEYYRLGQSALALKRGIDAGHFFRKAYELDPSLHRCLFQLGYISLVYEQNKENTISYWRRFLARDPQDPQADKIEEALRILEDPDFTLPSGASPEVVLTILQRGGKSLENEILTPKGKEADYLNQKEIYQKKDLLLEEE